MFNHIHRAMQGDTHHQPYITVSEYFQLHVAERSIIYSDTDDTERRVSPSVYEYGEMGTVSMALVNKQPGGTHTHVH